MPQQSARPDREPEFRDDGFRSNAERRRAWLADLAGLGDDAEDVIRAASELRAASDVAVPTAAPGAAGSNNWVRLGPGAVHNGQAFGAPVVSGRIVGLTVAPGGNRAYAGAADGGIWRYTRDTAVAPPRERWEPQDDFVMTGANPAAAANALSVGDIAVQFGATAANDTIFVGTGEGIPGGGTGTAGASFNGIGIRVSAGGAAPRTWALEGTNLAGQGVFRLAIDPDNPTVLFAATTAGVYRRPTTGSRASWTPVGEPPAPGPPPPPPPPFPTNPFPVNQPTVTDLRISGAGATKSIWVALHNDGVYRSTDANNAVWNRIGGLGPSGASVPGRISLATAPSDPNVVYALDQRARLYRFDAAVDAAFRRVFRIPNQTTLFSGQGFYDNVVTVDPANRDTVYIAGAVVLSERDIAGEQHWELSAFKGTLTSPGSSWRFGFRTTSNNSHGRAHRDATYVGKGVHGDGHVLTFGRNAAGNLDPTDVWIGCDGGVFRSTSSGANGSFRALNTGLATIQLTYFGHHPGLDTVLVAGCQDNGVVSYDGDTAWYENPKGDGGGCAVDPNHPYRMMAMYTGSTIYASTNGGSTGEWRDVSVPVNGDAPRFYSPLVTSPPHGNPPPGPGQPPAPATVLFGTDRVWATTGWNNTWLTLPTNTAPPNAAQDSLDGSNIQAMAWPTANRFYAATRNGVFRFDLVGGNWASTALSLAGLPGLPITSLAVHNAATDDIYIGVGGTGVNHVWRFNSATPTWTGTGVFTTAAGTADIPPLTLTVDPTTGDVFAGTSIGVFRAVRTGGATPAWTWTHFSQGLPEAGIIDLKVLTVPDGATPRRFLRAATHGRGAWEIELGTIVGTAPDVFVRANTTDSGRRLAVSRSVSATADPTYVRPTGATVTVDWTQSPDLAVRRSVDAQAPPAYAGTPLRRRANPPRNTQVGIWQRHALRRGFSLGPSGADRRFGNDTDAAVRAVQRRYRLLVWNSGPSVDGVVGRQTWEATVGYPVLPAPVDYVAFVRDLRSDVDEATRVMIADATGVNRAFLQVHCRAHVPVAAGTVRATLLVARFTAGAAPDLPAGYAARVHSGDTTGWLGGSGWQFADPASPFRTTVTPLTSLEPQVFEWPVDFAAVGFAAGDEVLLLGLVSSDIEPLTAAVASVQPLVEGVGVTLGDQRVAARRLRLDAVIDPTPTP